MTNHWHEQIQRYVNGQSSAEEAAALHEALNEDAELRALYLDYMNLDAALAAAAGAAPSVELEPGGLDASPLSPAQPSPHYWRWFAARYRGRSTIWAYDLRNEPHLAWELAAKNK